MNSEVGCESVTRLHLAGKAVWVAHFGCDYRRRKTFEVGEHDA